MVGNNPNIYIGDKSTKFGRDVCFGILFQKQNMAPRENPSLWHFGAIKMGGIYRTFSNFHLDWFIQNLAHLRKIKNLNCFADNFFLHIGHTFQINWYKIEQTSSPKFCISVCNEPIHTKFPLTTVELKGKTI